MNYQETTTPDGSTGANVGQVTAEQILAWRLGEKTNREPEKAAENVSIDDLTDLSDVASAFEKPNRRPRWKKPRSARQRPEPLVVDRLEYLRIFLCHHRNLDYTWSEIAILSEIDFFVGEKKKPCFASIKHYASVARVCPGTTKNLLKRLEADGVVFNMGYHGATKDRVVTPAHSQFPELSKRLIEEFRREVPF